ncbi:MAG: SDR family oxidoreductase [Pseudolabrys sp.]|nr:SDR family oxidoreductase [Pseudolabrys sp.]
MQAEFLDQVAVVTGAARGLGKSITTLLAERGAIVYMVDLDATQLAITEAELKAKGLRIESAAFDVANEDELLKLRQRLEKDHGRLDILINNAGGWRYGSASEIAISDWDWTFRTNVTSTFLATRTLMGLMTARNYGRVVNIASTDAYRPKPTLPHYAAAKAAIVSLTRTLAVELAPFNVLVNAVSPGMIETDTAKNKGWIEDRIKAIPVNRAAKPEDIAEVVLFLASARNRYVVGESILANGGALMA